MYNMGHFLPAPPFFSLFLSFSLSALPFFSLLYIHFVSLLKERNEGKDFCRNKKTKIKLRNCVRKEEEEARDGVPLPSPSWLLLAYRRTSSQFPCCCFGFAAARLVSWALRNAAGSRPKLRSARPLAGRTGSSSSSRVNHSAPSRWPREGETSAPAQIYLALQKERNKKEERKKRFDSRNQTYTLDARLMTQWLSFFVVFKFRARARALVVYIMHKYKRVIFMTLYRRGFIAARDAHLSFSLSLSLRLVVSQIKSKLEKRKKEKNKKREFVCCSWNSDERFRKKKN